MQVVWCLRVHTCVCYLSFVNMCVPFFAANPVPRHPHTTHTSPTQRTCCPRCVCHSCPVSNGAHCRSLSGQQLLPQGEALVAAVST